MTDIIRSWPLYAVADLRDREGIHLGELIQTETWALTGPPLTRSPHCLCLKTCALETTSGSTSYSAQSTPPTALTMVPHRRQVDGWTRRAFHNNNLRIGPAETRASHLAA